jgi:acyl carrier protein
LTPTEVRQVIVNALEEALSISKLRDIMPRMKDPEADIRFDELQFDSLSATEIVMTIVDETGYICDLGDFLAYPSIKALAEHIAAQGPAGR